MKKRAPKKPQKIVAVKKPAPGDPARADALARHFVTCLHNGSEAAREQLRRTATAAIYGRRQALDALCRLRSKGLTREDLAGIGRREQCGEWSSLWRLVERRSGEITADKRDAALAGDAEVKANERTDRLLAEVVKMESLLYEREMRIKELEGGAVLDNLRAQVAGYEEANRVLKRDLSHAQLDLVTHHWELTEQNETYLRELAALRDRSPLLRLKRWLTDLHAWGKPS